LIRLDPRAQLAWLAATVLGALGGGVPGLAGGGLLASAVLLRAGALAAWWRVVGALAPLAALMILLDALAGAPAHGLELAARLLVLGTIGLAFSRWTDDEAVIAGLRALRVPYAITFVLVAGARFIPAAAADVAQVRDAARLRGVVVDGPPWRQLAGWRLLLVPLVVSTVRRGLQLGEAMEARAFGAQPRRTVRYRLAWRARDTLAVLGAALYLAFALAAPRLPSLWPAGGAAP
jgi:energy-coupling factor transport system permease protein